MTRFQNRSEKVTYEIAQVTVIVENKSPEHDGIDIDGITVYAEDEVQFQLSEYIHAILIRPQNTKIKSHLTPSGLLFATLSEDTSNFEDFFEGLEELTNKVDFTKLPHRRSISYEGNFNWKTMYVLAPSR